MNRAARLVVMVAVIQASAVSGFAQDCNTNCQNFCRVDVGFTNFVDIACLPRCEVGKIAACNNVPLPPAHPPANPRSVCGEPFRQAMAHVAAACSNWADRLEDQHLLNAAKRVLVSRGLLRESDFAGIEARWCPSFVGEGIAPDQGRVYLHASLKQAHPISIAATLAHELYHIGQYRRLGADEFRCQYLGQMTACACQDSRHPLERDAYAFGDRVVEALDTAGYGSEWTGASTSPSGRGAPPVFGTLPPGTMRGGGVVPATRRCETPRGACELPKAIPAGFSCSCVGVYGTAR